MAAKVLLVEDDPALHDVAFDLLAENGVDVTGVMTMSEAEHLLASGYRPTAAVIDVDLPDGSGVELCKRLKAVDPRIRCLIFSSAEDLAVLAERASADDYLPKSAFADLKLRVSELMARASGG